MSRLEHADADAGRGAAMLPPVVVMFQNDLAYSLFPGGSVDVPIGGAAVSMYLLADELSKDKRLEVRWLFSPDVDSSALSHPHIKVVQVPGPIRRGIPIVSRWLNRRREIEAFRVRSRRAVMITSARTPSKRQWDAAVDSGVKTIVRVMGDLWVDLHGADAKYTGWMAERGVIGSAPSQVDELVLQTDQQKKLLKESGADRGVVVPGGWAYRDVVPGPDSDGYILWVGRCTALKRPWYFVELAELMPEEQFVMLLPADGAQHKLQEVMARRMARLPNLRIISDQLLLSDSQKLFEGAKVLVSTSEVEGFPVVFYQAGDAGIPIASLSFDPDGIIAREGFGGVAGGDVLELERIVRELANVGSPRASAAASATAQYFREVHDVRKTAARYTEVILGLWGGES